MRQKLIKKLMFGFVVVSILTTSFGGAFSAAVLAAEPKETVQDSNDSKKGLIGGLLAVGLLAMMTNKGNDNVGDAPKTQTPPANSGSVSSNTTLALKLLNEDRAKYGLPALKLNTSLTRLAENYAQDMINRGYFSHYNPEGQSPFDRMNAAGIGYRTAGENLAINSSVAGAEVAFMNSSGHRANILNSTYTEVGIGVRTSPNGQVYVVQEFISR
ncbi:CAP domain-containing protein [Dendrosporobacter sp. 1207_IL3150]|uniref:CAP domain-containing protein n=1 Tax=Dendrosporobacter sp. 1207_IL3150 TaxID=3084054 RepID=UPI002FD890CA